MIRGTNFDNPIATSVDIGGTPVSAFRIVSSTEIWATVAGDASGTIHVGNSSDTASSSTDYTNANPGGCSPTITFFTPCSGTAGNGGDHPRHEPPQELGHGHESARRGRRAIRALYGHGDAYWDTGDSEAAHVWSCRRAPQTDRSG